MGKRHIIMLLLAMAVLISSCGNHPSMSEVPTETELDVMKNTADIKTNLKKGLCRYPGDVFLSVVPVTIDYLLESQLDVYCFGVLIDGAQYLVRFCSEIAFQDEAHTIPINNYFVEIYFLSDSRDGLAGGGSLQEFLQGASTSVRQISGHTVNGADVGILGNRNHLYQMNPVPVAGDYSSVSEEGVYYFCTGNATPVFLPYARCAAYCTETGGIDCGIVALMAAMLADRDHPIQHF